MPGAYAHITLVNIAREPDRLEAGPGMPGEAIAALLDWFKYCELGAVSPDYPYLSIGGKQAVWADRMHYERSGAMVQAGVRALQPLQGEAKRKAFAWLLGYAAHVLADATIHPVVELKVGPYAQNKRAHRECEMHQDAYIFLRLKLGEVGLSEHLDSGISSCSAAALPNAIDPEIANLWHAMLRDCYPARHAAAAPDIDRWHRGFRAIVDDIAEEGNRLLPLARHVAVDCGLTYPGARGIDRAAYIDALAVPGGRLSYDQVFDKTLRHVIEGWHLLANAVFGADARYQTAFGDWNLDTGRDPTGRLVLWS
jgi:hypothetical protein